MFTRLLMLNNHLLHLDHPIPYLSPAHPPTRWLVPPHSWVSPPTRDWPLDFEFSLECELASCTTLRDSVCWCSVSKSKCNDLHYSRNTIESPASNFHIYFTPPPTPSSHPFLIYNDPPTHSVQLLLKYPHSHSCPDLDLVPTLSRPHRVRP